MATTVGQHQVGNLTSPVNGDPLNADIVRGNDNTVRAAYVDHDADPGIHLQSSALASRPAAGEAGRKWLTSDTGAVRLYYDTGSTWVEADYMLETGNPSSDISINGLRLGRGTSGSNNSTAFGYNALDSENVSAYSNTAIGYQALTSVTTGVENTGIGANAAAAISTTSNNTAVGAQAMVLPGASGSTAIGYNAMNSATGAECTAVGTTALFYATGARNTAIGYQAGVANTTGSNNTFIGNGSTGATAGTSNAITLGNSSIATLRCQVTTITSLSDARDKKDIVDIPAGLDFVKALQPRAFLWHMRDGGKVDVPEFGFIAQELQAAQATTGITVPGLVYDENPEKLEASAGVLIPVLVQAIKQLEARVAALESV